MSDGLKGDNMFYDYQQHKRKQKEKYEPVPPGPRDLTAQKILNRMSAIFNGDMIGFDSTRACYNSSQVDRHSTTIKVVAPVIKHCGGYVIVRLSGGLEEAVNYFDIETVNGSRWPWYIKRSSLGAQSNSDRMPPSLYEQVSEWR